MKLLVNACIVLGIATVGCNKASTTAQNDTVAMQKASAKNAKAENGLTQDLMKVSNDGYSAMRAIHSARIGIFNGDTKLVGEVLETAKQDLVAATKHVHTFAADAKAAGRDQKGSGKSASETMDLIPIDGGIAIADTFVPSAEKKVHIEKANEHFKAGRSEEAVQELQLGDIDVVYTRVLLPLEATEKRLADAAKFASEHKYYEANLALKAAEDGVVYDSVDVSVAPVPTSTASAAASTKK